MLLCIAQDVTATDLPLRDKWKVVGNMAHAGNLLFWSCDQGIWNLMMTLAVDVIF